MDLYLRSIGNIPVLTSRQTDELAEALRQAEEAFREAMFEIPGTAFRVVQRFEARRRGGLTTAALSRHGRDPGRRDAGEVLDRALERVAKLLPDDGKSLPAAGPTRKRWMRRVGKALREADLSLEVLRQIYDDLGGVLRGRGSVAQRERRELGLDREGRAAYQRATEALERYDDVRRLFVHHNLRLVIRFARRYRSLGVPFADLVQEGNLGLIRAVEKFDHRRGFKFSTYAVWWIEQAMIRAVQNQSRTVRVPSHLFELQYRRRAAEENLRSRLRREPTRAELAEALDVEEDLLERLGTAMAPVQSTEDRIPGTEDLTLGDALFDEDVEDPAEELDRDSAGRHIEPLLARLEPREREILRRRFGLGGEEPLSLAEIGRRIGLSRERVRQLERRALARLRETADLMGIDAPA